MRFASILGCACLIATLAACPPTVPLADAGTDVSAIDARLDDAAPDDAHTAPPDASLDSVSADTPTFPDACPPPTRLCGARCVDVEADPDHCGACDAPCVPLAGSIPFCASYICVNAVCRPGFGNCDMDRRNGCEVDVDGSIEHCGRCDRPCASAPHASPVCRLGSCALECEPGWTDCDTTLPGCECEA